MFFFLQMQCAKNQPIAFSLYQEQTHQAHTVCMLVSINYKAWLRPCTIIRTLLSYIYRTNETHTLILSELYKQDISVTHTKQQSIKAWRLWIYS